ncbi:MULTISPECIES: argonaute/piwi family protein [unclassified Nocardioides]|uniref:argonaute/piwi family protein n=1 Tax=unclassified Nocardioides TaxID=2615069 RepID=UPI00301459C7
MKITILDEPTLEFAHGGHHIDPRHGIDFYGPADLDDTAVRVIRVGIIGPQASIDGVKRWLDTCRSSISAKKSHLGHLYMPFPGFDTDRAFRSTIIWNSRLERPIAKRDLDTLDGASPLTAAQAAVDIYDRELEALHEEPNCDVVIVCRPDNLIDTGTRTRRGKSGEDASAPLPAGHGDFHSLLKARSLRYSQPIQLIRRSTWDPTFKDPKAAEVRVKQDEATRAWNLHTALYYKAGGVPWRLPRDPRDLASCYVGVAFYGTQEHETLETSVAQVFNQRGDGVIVRGGQARISKIDRQPHLTEDDAHRLLRDSLEKYRREHKQSPARIVLHKTSAFTDEEAAGFRAAANEQYIDILELIWLSRSEHLRLFRKGQQPPLRGTLMTLDDHRHVLYTRGSVPF